MLFTLKTVLNCYVIINWYSFTKAAEKCLYEKQYENEGLLPRESISVTVASEYWRWLSSSIFMINELC